VLTASNGRTFGMLVRWRVLLYLLLLLAALALSIGERTFGLSPRPLPATHDGSHAADD